MKSWSEYSVVRWTPDGKAIDGFLTGSCPTVCAGSLKVDAAGNLYIGMTGYPKSYKLPYSSPGDWFAGSVVKFKPTPETFGAGKEKPAGAIDWQGKGGYMPRWMGGVLDVYPLMAPVSVGAAGAGCTCKEARFDLDLYGRLYIPNVLTYRVTLVDNAGNVILKAGHYGNADSEGPGEISRVRKPEVPLGWPMTVGAAPDHDHVYAGDVINSRVVRIDLTHAAEATCEVGASGGASAQPAPAPAPAGAVGNAAPGTPAAQPAAAPGRTPEQVCTGWFSAARNYQRAGMLSDARRCLGNIIKEYPGTTWAAQAHEELAKL